MSKNSFKSLVQKKAKEYEFLCFLEIKMSKSKIKNLNYTQLKKQDYLLLKNMNVNEARALFKFRVRMSPFGENFRGGREIKICPFCQNYPDGQEESFYCLEMKKLMEIKGNYRHIFGWTFPGELVKTVYNIHTFREEYRKLG